MQFGANLAQWAVQSCAQGIGDLEKLGQQGQFQELAAGDGSDPFKCLRMSALCREGSRDNPLSTWNCKASVLLWGQGFNEPVRSP